MRGHRAVFASVVFIACEMSRRIANTGWLQLMFSGAGGGIGLFHGSLREVIWSALCYGRDAGAGSCPFCRHNKADLLRPYEDCVVFCLR
jgi:hypothetical protein